MKTKITYLLLILPFLTFAQGPWEFNTASDIEGWAGATTQVNSATLSTTTVSQSGTTLIVQTTATASGRNPNINKPAAGIVIANTNRLEIRLKNNSLTGTTPNGPTTYIRFWVSVDGGALNNNIVPGIAITASDATFKTYVANLSGVASTSTITQIYLEFKVNNSTAAGANYTPTAPAPTIEIDYIRPFNFVAPTRNAFNFNTDVEGFTTLTRSTAVQATDGSNGTLQLKATAVNTGDSKVALNSDTYSVDCTTNKYAHITLKNTSTNTRFALAVGGTTYLPHQAYTTGDASYKTYDFNLSAATGIVQPDISFGVQTTWLATAVYAVNDQVISSNSTYKNLTGINTANNPRADIAANAAAVPPLPQNWELVGTEGALLDFTNSIFIDSIVFDTDGTFLGTSDFGYANNTISLYPNPARDVLNVSSANGISKIEVYDMLGKKVASKNNASDINVSDLGKGVYIISVLQDNGSVVAKQFVKE